MKKALLLSMCLLTILGCSSLPERKSPDQTVAVLKVSRLFLDNRDQETIKPEKYTPMHVYYFTIDDDPKEYVIQQEYFQYIFTDLPPGPHKISSIRMHLISAAAGKEKTTPISIPFELKPGCITIIDKSFCFMIKMIGPYSYYYWEKFADIKPEEKTGIIEKLAKESSYKTWELAE